jgi:hypothetical protein
MRLYEKIETVYQRDMEGTKALMPGVWRSSTVEYLKDLEWEWTEKVDGTNIRVIWDGHTVSFGGRTKNALIPAPLINYLNEVFGTSEAEQLFEQLFGEREVILFGEGYGKKIQGCGAKYIPDGVAFILFDLLIGDNYQSREDVDRCAKSFGVKSVPIVGRGTLEQAISFVKTHPNSTLGDLPMEGVVCRPKYELRDRCHNRLIVKIKYMDFK